MSVIWEKGSASAVAISWESPDQQGNTYVPRNLHIRRLTSSTDILGSFKNENSSTVFRPLIPLLPGTSYVVIEDSNIIDTVHIPKRVNAVRPELTAIFPSSDTVPENLLKLYFQFSAAMREGEALRHISMLDEKNDTLPGVFLDLQPELWNADRTVLTVWLDPGRIKRDLIPNKQMGNPLTPGHAYTLVVDTGWQNAAGVNLKSPLVKRLFVEWRDSLMPQPAQWKISTPSAGSTSALVIKLNEPLDYFLLQETIAVLNRHQVVGGKFSVSKKETWVEFIPAEPWKAGSYSIQIASILEDMAGNNLDKPFDRDLLAGHRQVSQGKAGLAFEIKALP